MDNIKDKYDEFLKLPFPEGLRGEEILGIELILLDSDSAGLIDKCIGNKGHLTQSDFKILKKCFTDLKTIVKELKGNNRTYFGLLLNIVHQTVDYLKANNQLINKEKEQLIKEWQTDFDKIRKILNDWDPIGVADVVDDEYDSINFLAYSALRNKGTLEGIKKAIKEYMNDSMELDVPDSDLTEIAQKIKMIHEV
jgi:hypothetical protein